MANNAFTVIIDHIHIKITIKEIEKSSTYNPTVQIIPVLVFLCSVPASATYT